MFDHHLTDKKVLYIETNSVLTDSGNIACFSNCFPIFDQEKMINEKVMIGDQEYALTAVSLGNPHVIRMLIH